MSRRKHPWRRAARPRQYLRASVLAAVLPCLCAALPTLLPEAAASDAAGAPGAAALGQLMMQLAERQHAEARFQEWQYLSALTRPLQSAGTLLYDAPDHLEQRIDTPRHQQMVLDHRQLTLQMGKRRRTVQLADYPQLAPLLDSIRATLAGDLPALRQSFVLRFEGPVSQWSLHLTPRDPAISATLREIRLQGQGIQIREVSIEQTDGDHAVMHIEPLS
jgi:hypothetical protein